VSQNRWKISGGVAKKLLNPLRKELHLKRYSYRTEQACMDWLRTFSLFHGERHPAEMGVAEYRAFLIHPAQDG
jgi:hypothetical protein